jgi:hypothetical protein
MYTYTQRSTTVSMAAYCIIDGGSTKAATYVLAWIRSGGCRAVPCAVQWSLRSHARVTARDRKRPPAGGSGEPRDVTLRERTNEHVTPSIHPSVRPPSMQQDRCQQAKGTLSFPCRLRSGLCICPEAGTGDGSTYLSRLHVLLIC